MKRQRGAFICFEGIDHSGKSTQARLVADKLITEGVDVQVITFPDRSSSIGVLINEYLTDKSRVLDDHVIHLLYAANRWEKMLEIKKLLEKGVTVIVDRYSYSGIAYTLAKSRDFSFEWCVACERGLVKPDAVIFFDIDVQTALDRGNASGKREERYETNAFLSTVKNIYQKLLFRNPRLWKRVDANSEPKDVLSKVFSFIHETMKDVAHRPIEVIQ